MEFMLSPTCRGVASSCEPLNSRSISEQFRLCFKLFVEIESSEVLGESRTRPDYM